MKKDTSKTLVIILLSLLVIYLLFRYAIPRIFAYVIVILAFLPSLVSAIIGVAIVVLILYLIFKLLRK